jgi:hypothetical protein
VGKTPPHPSQLETILGLAFLENHPRFEVMRGLADIAAHLPETEQSAICGCVLQIFLPSTPKTPVLKQDVVFLALLAFCEDCVQTDFLTMAQKPFREARVWMERILQALETVWRLGQVSSADLAANRALDWLGESIGQHLNSAELAGLRGYYMRRRNLRT